LYKETAQIKSKEYLMQLSSSIKRLNVVKRNLLSVICCFLIIAAAWLGVCLDNSVALAEPQGVKSTIAMDGAIANQPVAFNELKSKVKTDLSDRDHARVSQSSAGSYQGKSEAVDEPSYLESDPIVKRAKEMGGAVDGRSKETVAKVQGEATAKDKVENAIEDVMDNIREKVN
jgi:ABC-type Na+ efflux pump permease subunit